jgi:hypothetical protein
MPRRVHACQGATFSIRKSGVFNSCASSNKPWECFSDPGLLKMIVIAGLDPAIHPLSQEDGCAGQARA